MISAVISKLLLPIKFCAAPRLQFWAAVINSVVSASFISVLLVMLPLGGGGGGGGGGFFNF